MQTIQNVNFKPLRRIAAKCLTPEPFFATAIGISIGVILAFHYRSVGLEAALNKERYKIIWFDHTLPSCAQTGGAGAFFGWLGMTWLGSHQKRRGQAPESESPPPQPYYAHPKQPQAFFSPPAAPEQPDDQFNHPIPFTDLAGGGHCSDPWESAQNGSKSN